MFHGLKLKSRAIFALSSRREYTQGENAEKFIKAIAFYFSTGFSYVALLMRIFSQEKAVI